MSERNQKTLLGILAIAVIGGIGLGYCALAFQNGISLGKDTGLIAIVGGLAGIAGKFLGSESKS